MTKRGLFLTRLRIEDAGDGRHFILTAPLEYRTRGGAVVTVPTGFVTDLASIPRALFIALPPIGKYDYAAVVHDYLYRTDSDPVVDQKTADLAILHGMEDAPHPPNWLVRHLVYAGVRFGGGHAFHQHLVAWLPAGVSRSA